jgi:hypothetical protein
VRRDKTISSRDYYLANKKKILAQQREYKKTTRDKRLPQMREYSRQRYSKVKKIVQVDDIIRFKMSLHEMSTIVYNNAITSIAYEHRKKWKQLRRDLEEINRMRIAA